MKRRAFLSAAVAGPTLAGASHGSTAAGGRQYLELRQYHLPGGPKKNRIRDFLDRVGVAALNRQGVRPVGVFDVLYGPSRPTIYVLLSHPSLESVATLPDRLLADSEFAESDFAQASLEDPAYNRIESSLMVAFEGMPRLQVPAQQAGQRRRIFELRTYESHSLRAAKKKIEMFNAGGEIEIFRKVGLHPVFFGETLVGAQIPNLTYMLVFDNLTARDAAWDRFRKDSDWEKLSRDRQYAGTVSNITDIILRPAPFSQI